MRGEYNVIMINRPPFDLRAERSRYGRLVTQGDLARALGTPYDRPMIVAIERQIVWIDPAEEARIRATIQRLAATPSMVRPRGRPRKTATGTVAEGI